MTYLHPANHHSAKIRTVYIICKSELDFKDIQFPVKIRDIKKTQTRILSPLAF